MCCGRNRRSTKRGRSGRLPANSVQIQAVNNEQHTENIERLLVLPIDGVRDQTRPMGPPPIQGQELLP